MTQSDPGSALVERRAIEGRLGGIIAIGGMALWALGLVAYYELGPDQASPTRFAAFVALPTFLMGLLFWSGGHRSRPLLLAVVLLDVEAVLLADVPIEGMATAVVVPLLGVALVTNLLPAERLGVPYVAAWVAGSLGVGWSLVSSSKPSDQVVPVLTIVPTFAVIDAAALLLLWQIYRRRSAALRAVAEAEARLRGLLEGVDLIALDTDGEGRVAFMNSFGLELTGWSGDEVIGRDWYDTFATAERRDAARERFARVRGGLETMPTQRESEILTRGGERRLIHWSHVVRRDAEGRFAGLASIGEDITAARTAEEAVRRAGELTQTLIVASPLATAIIGLDRKVQLWNPALAGLLGWSADEVVGREVPDLVPPGMDPATFGQIFARVVGGEAIRGVRVRIRRRDGDELRLLLYADALRDKEGRAMAVAAQAVDVTAQEAMEQRLREAQKMEAVGRLAGGVAHDFNNSLTAIGGFAALIAASTDDPETREEAESIGAAVRRASNLTRELLAYARRSLLQPEAIEVNALVGAVRPMLRRLLGEDVAVVIESGVPEAMVRVDPGQLEQAILNLAANARDAMPHGGRLTIRTSRRAVAEADMPVAGAVAARASGGDGAGATGGDARSAPGGDGRSAPVGAGGSREPRRWVVISVTDTGSGIPPELQSQVFDPFFTTKPVGAGTGLGLAMVQGFVVQSGGRVALHSETGAGTTVEILLPEVVDQVPAARPAVEPQAAGGGGETIVFVEDEPAVAAVGFQLLSRRGYRVLLADSGATATAILEAHEGPIALLLADVILPDMRGPQVAEVARRRHPEAAILYASGYSADTFTRRGELNEDVDLIEKPYAPEQLALRVRAAIERGRKGAPERTAAT